MTTRLRVALVLAALSLPVLASADAADPGELDFASFDPSAQSRRVEIDLSPGLLRLAAKLAAWREQPEAAELLRGLKRVRVHVTGPAGAGRADAVARVGAVREHLARQGWTRVAAVSERAGGEDVDVHVKTGPDDGIDGLAVTAVDRRGEVVFVNIVGRIDPAQLAALAERLDLELRRRGHRRSPPEPAAKPS